MSCQPDFQCLRERILQAHLRIRISDVRQFIHPAFFPGVTTDRRHRKICRFRIKQVLESLVQSDVIERHSIVRPFYTADAFSLADEPFVRWAPGDPPPPFDLGVTGLPLSRNTFKGRDLREIGDDRNGLREDNIGPR